MNNKTIVFQGEGARDTYKQVPTQDGLGKTSERDGREYYHYEVVLDVDAVRGMANQAAKNKNGKAVRGPIVVKITKRHKVS